MPLGVFASRQKWEKKLSNGGLAVLEAGYKEREDVNLSNEDMYRSYIEVFTVKRVEILTNPVVKRHKPN